MSSDLRTRLFEYSKIYRNRPGIMIHTDIYIWRTANSRILDLLIKRIKNPGTTSYDRITGSALLGLTRRRPPLLLAAICCF